MKIGLALSGGGFRATVCHMGVLARLAESPEMWKGLKHVSTVSGGSLCVGLIFEKAGRKWPTAEQYLDDCLPQAFSLLTTLDIQRRYIASIFCKPWRLAQGRAHVLAKLLEKHWGLGGTVADMPRENPRWTINATCYETGRNWRFAAKRMGDYLANYVMEPEFALADAVAASAAVPGLIGPLRLDTYKRDWRQFKGNNNEHVPAEPIAKTLTLWDGGIYDNLGTEMLIKPGKGFRHDVDYMICSDASKPLGIEDRKWFGRFPKPSLKAKSAFRLIDIATEQIRALRCRFAVSEFLTNGTGMHLRQGTTTEGILKKAKKIDVLPTGVLGEDQAKAVAAFPTRLNRYSNEDFQLIFRHGYEICDVNMLAADKAGELFQYDCSKFRWLNSKGTDDV